MPVQARLEARSSQALSDLIRVLPVEAKRLQNPPPNVRLTLDEAIKEAIFGLLLIPYEKLLDRIVTKDIATTIHTEAWVGKRLAHLKQFGPQVQDYAAEPNTTPKRYRVTGFESVLKALKTFASYQEELIATIVLASKKHTEVYGAACILSDDGQIWVRSVLNGHAIEIEVVGPASLIQRLRDMDMEK